MPDARRHRGHHPIDPELFAPERLETLRRATTDLSWLLGRGYSEKAAVALVGDHFQLHKRQRTAIARCACGETAGEERRKRRLSTSALAGRLVAVDGLNCVITLEAALAGGLILRTRDGCHRDLASVHGSYRMVEETGPAIERLLTVLQEAGPAKLCWFLDRPVSNSGRLKARILECAALVGIPVDVELVNAPDRAIVAVDGAVAASSDSWILDRSTAWVDLPGELLSDIPAWVVEL